MSELVSTDVSNTEINFVFEKNNPTFPFADVHLQVTFIDDLAHLTGRFSDDTYDGDQYDLDALARKVVPYHVDGVNGNDNNDGLTRETAFATIQKGIDTAEDGDTVLVWPDVYNEGVDFDGKKITVKSADEPAVLTNPVDYTAAFYTGEDASSVLKNFIITNSYEGIFIAASSPTLTNLTVVDNTYGIRAYAGAQPDISNCIFWDNTDGDLFQCEARYSYVQDELGFVEDLISYWKFEGDADDEAGNNDGTVYGAALTDGISGQAYQFDDTNDYIDLGNDTSLKPQLPVTLTAWVKRAESDKGRRIIGLDNRQVAFYGVWLRIKTGGNIEVSFGAGTGLGPQNRRTKLGTTVLELDTWYHIAGVVRGAGDMDIYIDGVDDGGTYGGTGGSLAYSDGSSFIGGDPLSGSLQCTIDEVMVFNSDLSYEEVNQIYQEGLDEHDIVGPPRFADSNDYHLRSERGRYWPEHDVWVLDDVTSPCVDGGDPAVEPNGPMPNGGRVNMGAYGDTAYASMSEWPIAGDVNHDGVVDMIDFAIVAEDWLSTLPWAE